MPTMVEKSVDDLQKPYVAALKKIGSRGLTRLEGSVAQDLLSLAPFKDMNLPQNPLERVAIVRDRLITACSKHLQPDALAKAEQALGFGSALNTRVQERHWNFAQLCGKKNWTAVREGSYIDTLMEITWALVQDGPWSAEAEQLSACARPEPPAEEYHFDDTHNVYFLTDSRTVCKVHVRKKIHATVDGVTKFGTFHQYVSESRSDFMRVEFPWGARLAQEKRVRNTLFLLWELPWELRADEKRDFGYELIVNTEREMTPIIAFGMDVTKQVETISTQFSPGAPPKRPYYFENLQEFLKPGPFDESRELFLDQFGFVSKTFSKPPAPGRSSGIAWDW